MVERRYSRRRSGRMEEVYKSNWARGLTLQLSTVGLSYFSLGLTITVPFPII